MTVRSKLFWAALVIPALLLLLHVVVLPLRSAQTFRAALMAQDGPLLASRIDFNALHESVTRQFTELETARPNDFEALMRASIVTGMVVNFVTEENVRALGASHSPFSPSGRGAGFNADPRLLDMEAAAADIQTSFRFGLTRFVVNVSLPEGPTFGIVFAPRGLTWKVVSVEFPI